MSDMSRTVADRPADRPASADVTEPDTPTVRERNPRGHGDHLRIELLDAAAELMAEKGDVDAISLRAIAARAGVSPTAVYRHFDDHLDLLRAAVVYCWEEFERALVESDAGLTDPYDRLRASGDAYVRFAMEQSGKYHVLFSNKIDVQFEGTPVGVSTFEMLVDKVATILQAREDDRDPRFVAVQVHTWMHGIVDLIGRHGDFEWPPPEVLLTDLQERLGLSRPD
jgi:AcrR family transcriptional regulator